MSKEQNLKDKDNLQVRLIGGISSSTAKQAIQSLEASAKIGRQLIFNSDDSDEQGDYEVMEKLNAINEAIEEILRVSTQKD
tara:strand:- start:336 stop:578 length:243 start_codon:yes stop_codon:yes gene_type:complete